MPPPNNDILMYLLIFSPSIRGKLWCADGPIWCVTSRFDLICVLLTRYTRDTYRFGYLLAYNPLYMGGVAFKYHKHRAAACGDIRSHQSY